MGFAKGSISLSPTKDVPLLLQVLHSQFITHDQLRDFTRLGCHELNGHSFNWRVHRLVENRFLDRHCVPGVSGNIYSLGSISKPILADHFPMMDLKRHKDAASHVNLIHSLELNRLHLSLVAQRVLVEWESEMSIRAANELTPNGYLKNYDAIVTVEVPWDISFALEYERSPKKPKTYSRIRSLMEQEPEIGIFLYVAPERNLASLLSDCFFETTADIYIGLAAQFMQSFADMDVIEAASGKTVRMSTVA